MKRFNSTLEQRTPLKARITLKAKHGLNKVSDKQKRLNNIWTEIKIKRIDLLRTKYGFLPCEWCKLPIRDNEIVDPHHNEKRRANNYVLSNCRILHRICHDFVTDNNIKDVPDLLNGID